MTDSDATKRPGPLGADEMPGQGDQRMTRVAVVVLGAHRSGTSAVARVISLLGAALPEDILEPNATNPAGHWEPQRVADLNDEIFASAGSSWDDVNAFPHSWYGSTSEAVFRGRAATILAEEYGDASLFVLKDPRISRIVPFWLSVLDDLGVQPCFVVMVRNPLEVAGSIRERDGFSTAKGALIWLRNMLDAEFSVRSHPSVFVSYEELLRDWEPQLRSISDSLGQSWPRLGNAARAEIDRFLSSANRHHSFSPRDLIEHPSTTAWVKDAYLTLNDAATEERAPDHQVLDGIKAQLDEAERAFGPIVADVAGEAAVHDDEMVAWGKEIETLRSAIADYAQNQEALLEQRVGLEKRISEATASENDARQAAAELEARVEEGERELHFTLEQLAVVEAERATYSSAAEERLVHLSELTTRNEALTARAERSEATAVQAEASVLRAESEARSQSAAAAEFASLLRAQTRLLRELEAQVAGMQERLASSRAQLAELHGTRSWKITAPLRSLQARLRPGR